MTEMLPMLAVFAIAGAVVFAAAALVLRNMDSAGLYTALTMLIFCNSGILGRLLKTYFGWFRDKCCSTTVSRIMTLIGRLLICRMC